MQIEWLVYITNVEYTPTPNVVSNTRINYLTLWQTHLLLYSNNLLLLLRVPEYRSRSINAAQLETGYSIQTVGVLPIEVETIPVGMNELTQTYNSIAGKNISYSLVCVSLIKSWLHCFISSNVWEMRMLWYYISKWKLIVYLNYY